MVDEAVEHHRSAGVKFQEAREKVGRLFGINPRRVAGIRAGEAARITLEEYASIRDGFCRHLDAEARRLDARAALLRARRDALR
jgi:phosphatidylserine decarboxylase